MGCFCYIQHTHCHKAIVRRFTWSQEEYLRISLFCQIARHDLNSSDMVKPSHLVPRAGYKLSAYPAAHACTTRCQSPFKTMLAAVTPPQQQQDHALRFHTDSVRKDESQGHSSCLWVALSLRGTGNVSCDIWPHHLELLAPSERTQDLSPLLSQHPLMPHQAGLVSLLQASCDRQPAQGRTTNN